MRMLPVVAALILVCLGVATPRTASAQEVNGRLELTVHMCVNPPVFPYASYPTVVGTFSETLCYIESSADPSQTMTIQLDGGADGFTVTEPFAPLFWPAVSLTPGAYTLTITTPQRDGPLVTSTALTISADQTTALTYTLIYPMEVGSGPPPPPVDDVPEVPADPVVTPAPTEAVVANDPAPPGDGEALPDNSDADLGDVTSTAEVGLGDPSIPREASPDNGDAGPDDVPSAPPAPTAVVTLPNTGSGSIAASSAFSWIAFGLASFGSVTGALVTRRRHA